MTAYSFRNFFMWNFFALYFYETVIELGIAIGLGFQSDHFWNKGEDPTDEAAI